EGECPSSLRRRGLRVWPSCRPGAPRGVFRRSRRAPSCAATARIWRGDSFGSVDVADSISRVPELPDILAYLAALEPRVVGKRLEAVRLGSPFLLRSIAPPLSKLEGRGGVGLSRVGKRVGLASG